MAWRHNPAFFLRSPGLRTPQARIALFAGFAAASFLVWWQLGTGDTTTPAAKETSVALATATPPPGPPGPGATIPAVALGQLDTAARLLRDGDPESAATAYLSIALSSPGVRAEALLGAGIAKFEAGDADAAVEALRGSVAASYSTNLTIQRRASYLLGLRLNNAGRPAEALAALQRVAQSSTVDALQPYILVEFARAAAATGDAITAAAAWDTVIASPQATSTLRAEAYQDRANAAAAAGDTAAAAGWLTKLVALKPDPSIRYDLANAALKRGDPATYATQLRAILNESPDSPFAPRALADLKDAGYEVDPGREGYIDYRQGAYAEARRVLTAAVAIPGIATADLAYRSFYLAAAYEDSGNLSTAITWYDSAANADPGSSIAHRARYWAARSIESLGDRRSASARYLALVKDGPAGEFTYEAAFRAGYTLLTDGDAAGAISTWDALGIASDSRLLYWKARAYERVGNSAAAQATYAQSAQVGPFDFYGLLAARATGQTANVDVTYQPRTFPKTVDWDSIEAWLTTFAGPKPPTAYPPTPARDFMAVNLRDRAEAVILEESSGADQWRLLALIREAYDAGLMSTTARLAVQLRESTGVSPALVPKAITQLSYPVDYVTSLDEQARANNVDPLFLAALIRQESFWNPAAYSSAGAIGLTQVIPSTGDGIARALGLPNWKPGDLLRPVVSLQFGAYYIGGQLKHYGSPLAALAAYNAGPGNAIRWTTIANPANAADFIEAIDIPETKNYVQSVMEYYALYLRAYT